MELTRFFFNLTLHLASDQPYARVEFKSQFFKSAQMTSSPNIDAEGFLFRDNRS